MRILLCGSRTWQDRTMVDTVIAGLVNCGSITVVHGGANGADTIAAEIAVRYGFETEAHPAEWDRHGRAAGPIRNQKMLDSGVDLVIAFTDSPVTPGTKDMVTRATQALGAEKVWVFGHSPAAPVSQPSLEGIG